ncbi:hypothetical protein [Dapis sp. BLCC M172]|uniref:hypothetical protein n=1 Tax=Dapis sp. BLCC M172 TaxID=2975281 RepID=UPI003CEA437B
MIINTELLVNNQEIIQGLLTGEMTRYGSVIRWSAGTEKAGKIVKHLVETPGVTNQLINLPLTPISSGSGIIRNGINYHQLLGIQQSLSQVMGLTQIAAGSSILNLGVSIAGFAYMGFQLHQIQKSLGHLQQTMETGFARVEAGFKNLDNKITEGFTVVLQGLNHLDNRLNTVSGQLAYLYLLVQDSRQKQESLAKAISNIHKAMLIKEIATLNAELNYIKLFPNESRRQALKTTSAVRLFLASQAMQSTPELDAELMLNTDIAIQGWAVATATEGNLLLEIGQHQEAKQLLAEEVPKFQQVAQTWGNELINSNHKSELATAYRFATEPFQQYITPERVARIKQISPGDANLKTDQIRRQKNEAEVELKMSYARERYNQIWLNQQIAIAEYLDTLSELSARLDSLQEFAALCESQGVKSSREILPKNVESGLYILSA